MEMIANETAYRMVADKRAVVIDVREPAEFQEFHLPGAVNLPSTQFNPEEYRFYGEQLLVLVCQTGSRAHAVAVTLSQYGINRVSLLAVQMEALWDLAQAGSASQTQYPVLQADVPLPHPQPPVRWGIDRQFRLTLGLFLAIFLLGYLLSGSLYFFIIPGIVCAGLLYSAVTDTCYLRIGIVRLPWNRAEKARQTGSRVLYFSTKSVQGAESNVQS